MTTATGEVSAPPTRFRVLLIVSGGIAAYKAPALVREFMRRGAEVQVVATPSALSFVTELSLRTVSGRAVRTSLLDPAEEGSVGHIELADWADVVVVAPATAHRMALSAQGLAPDLAATVLLATTAPVLWAPAMNTNMWRHPATVANLGVLRERGDHFVGPDQGALACGWVGEGRMIDPPMIVEAAAQLRAAATRTDTWRGRKVLVSAGPTRTYLDPVRFITNASSGEMGFALAAAAAAQGAEVVLVSGPLERATPAGVRRMHVETADEMLEAMRGVLDEAPQDLVAMVAAVADLEATPSPQKLPKDALATAMANRLKRGVDVLATLTDAYAERGFFLGFGAQTVDSDAPPDIRAALIEAGRQKLTAKNCDAIFVNRVGVPGVGFSSHTNTGLLLRAVSENVADPGPPMPKPELASWILAQLAQEVGR